MSRPNANTDTSNLKRPNTRPHPPPSAISSSTSASSPPETKARPKDNRQRSRSKSLLGRLMIPIPPSLQNSAWLQSPLSIFRRPYPSSRTPDKDSEDRWLGDTTPMPVDSDDAQSFPDSASGSLRRKSGRGEMKSTPPPDQMLGKIPTKNASEKSPPSSLTPSTPSSTDTPDPNHSPTAGKAESGVS